MAGSEAAGRKERPRNRRRGRAMTGSEGLAAPAPSLSRSGATRAEDRPTSAAAPRRPRGRPPKTPTDPPFPNRIREWREGSGLTQQQLADRASLSKQQVSALERGAKQIIPSTGRRIAAALSCTLADLLAEEQPDSIPVTLRIASASNEAQPVSFEVDPGRRITLGARFERAGAYFAAEVADDSADCDYPPASILVLRAFKPGEPIAFGSPIVVRFRPDRMSAFGPRRTGAILYGRLEPGGSGDILLATRSRNPKIPPFLTVIPARADSNLNGFRNAPGAPQAHTFEPQADGPAEIIGLVVWQSGPPRG